MNDEQGNEYEFPTFERISTIAKEMFAAALSDYPPIIATATVEQMRSSIRDHLAGVECDPQDPGQLRAFALGAVFTIYRQGQYTPIGAETSIVPAIAINMLDAPFVESEMMSYEGIRAIFEPEIIQETVQYSREPRLINFLRQFINFWDSRNERKSHISTK
jgi:hypothetical protein